VAKTHIVVSEKHGLVFARNRINIGMWLMSKRMRRQSKPKRYNPSGFEVLTDWWWRNVRPKIDR
jgi:hypothetical protein